MTDINVTLSYFEAQVVAEALAAYRRALKGKIARSPNGAKAARWGSDLHLTSNVEGRLADLSPRYR